MARRLTDPGAIAQRLGVSQEAIRRIQRRGFLQHLELDDAEIRERLLRAHVAFALRQRLGASHRAVQLEDH